MHDGRVRRAYLGLVSTPARLTPVQAERYGQRGALRVVEVVERSPAAQSGLLAGDLVLAIDGAPLGDAQSLRKRFFTDAIGQRMEVTVLRDGISWTPWCCRADSRTEAPQNSMTCRRAVPAASSSMASLTSSSVIRDETSASTGRRPPPPPGEHRDVPRRHRGPR